MKPAVLLALGVAAAVALYALWPAADQANDPSAADASGDQADAPADDTNAQEPSTLDAMTNAVTSLFSSNPTVADALGSANAQAFLAMLRYSEGTARAADPWRVCFGFQHTIADMSDHPANTGEWTGAQFTDLAGRTHTTTAAGAYQFLRGTWNDLKGKLQLPDFTASSQDAAALELVRERGALGDVVAGNFTRAVAACAKTWASLPGAGYAQPEQRLASLQSAYAAAGGAVVSETA